MSQGRKETADLFLRQLSSHDIPRLGFESGLVARSLRKGSKRCLNCPVKITSLLGRGLARHGMVSSEFKLRIFDNWRVNTGTRLRGMVELRRQLQTIATLKLRKAKEETRISN